uniref:Subtilisin n=1 Tax=Corethron hystrix TaxID=216773 RepID=A0A7S1B9H3_9STRA|mmetsp:Transcript_18152/g.41334  ORF Transcript_18152/g.41334 Transcript_18152/m.41334 type:complete len:105 (+) Transcript_18152:111-425(+)
MMKLFLVLLAFLHSVSSFSAESSFRSPAFASINTRYIGSLPSSKLTRIFMSDSEEMSAEDVAAGIEAAKAAAAGDLYDDQVCLDTVVIDKCTYENLTIAYSVLL